ncbi:hypothetical protein M1D58_27420 (plasmid) [Pseudomonas sp. R4-76]|uniref:hypothetical protein n=1 Tax=unclassified Pseudomonas TaxID=196821 RepID=UPI003DA938CB
MIPVEVIDGLINGWRFTQQHPVVTGVVIAVLLALAFLAAMRSRRSPQRKFLRAVSVLLVIGAVGFYSWAYTTRSPRLSEQVQTLVDQASIDETKEREAKQAGPTVSAHNCQTTGANSPIVTGENSVVVINGKTYAPGQSSDCAPGSTNISTHGAGSPIVTGAGAKVSVHVE